MKNTKICPKCAGTDIRRAEDKTMRNSGGNNILLGVLASSAVPVHRYVCCSCGYAEEWVDEEDLVKLRVYL